MHCTIKKNICMMTIIYQTDYNTLILVNPTFIKNVWASDNLAATEDDIREIINTTANFIRERKPAYFLADDSNRQFVYDIEIQAWVAQTLAMACAEVGLKKFAIIVPKDFIAELSTEQTVDEAGTLPFQLQYFVSEAEALQWLDN